MAKADCLRFRNIYHAEEGHQEHEGTQASLQDARLGFKMRTEQEEVGGPELPHSSFSAVKHCRDAAATYVLPNKSKSSYPEFTILARLPC